MKKRKFSGSAPMSAMKGKTGRPSAKPSATSTGRPAPSPSVTATSGPAAGAASGTAGGTSGGGSAMKKGGTVKKSKWIQKAINPAHKGYCTPMTKPTCTPRRKALAMTLKKMAKDRKGK